MKRVFIALCLCMMWLADIMAQEIVSGTVVDSKNNPLPGVRVEIVGRTEVAYSDIDGIFRFDLPAKAEKIRVSYVGYKPFERKIKPDMVVKMGNGWAGKPSGFRFLLDMYGGIGIGGKVNVEAGSLSINNIHPGINFGMTYSFGWQINRNLYVGVGYGLIMNMMYSEVNENYSDNHYHYADHSFYSGCVPIFADVRWDFGLGESEAPYVGIKLGYQLNPLVDDSDYYFKAAYGNERLSLFGERVDGLFFMPSVGMRKALGSKIGINLGLSYNVVLPKKLRAEYSYDGGTDYMDLGKSNSGVMMLNIGFDF